MRDNIILFFIIICVFVFGILIGITFGIGIGKDSLVQMMQNDGFEVFCILAGYQEIDNCTVYKNEVTCVGTLPIPNKD